MSTVKRPAAPRQAKPAQRYFRGKALPGAGAGVPSDSDESDAEDEDAQFAAEDIPLRGDIGGDDGIEEDQDEDDEYGRSRVTAPTAGKAMNVALRNVNIRDGKVLVDGRDEVGRTEMEGV